MNRHEGVSCDACMKSNFKGRRYKCLRCYDYDLCAACYEGGSATSRHLPDHPVQCILSRADFDLFYGGESNEIHSLTCPFCCKFGFTEHDLMNHISAEHGNNNTEVVCPICAAVPGGEPNLVTDDLNSHITLEHRPSTASHTEENSHRLRRVQQPSRVVGRGRRPNMHFSSGGLSPAAGNVDPIAELLSQLSGVRRAAAVPYDRLLRGQAAVPRRTTAPPPEAAVAKPPPEKNPYLLDQCNGNGGELNADQSLFLQDLLLATLIDSPSPSESSDSEREEKELKE